MIWGKWDAPGGQNDSGFLRCLTDDADENEFGKELFEVMGIIQGYCVEEE